MSDARKPHSISVDDNLAGELRSQVKHEYLGSFVYAMAGGMNTHNLVASNVLGSLHARLRGTGGRPYNSAARIRVNLATHVRFDYPDVSVVCEPNSGEESFQDRPVVIVEMLSRTTRRIDQGEKHDAYLAIPTLQAYLLIEQDSPAVRVHRRTEQGFLHDDYAGMQAVIPLPGINVELPFSEVYDGIEFVPEPDEEECRYACC